MTITTHRQKGSALTWNELDNNFEELAAGQAQIGGSLAEIDAAVAETEANATAAGEARDQAVAAAAIYDDMNAAFVAQAIAVDALAAEVIELGTLLDGKVDDNTLAAPGGSALVGFEQAGTGAVPRDAEEKQREISFSANDFGAKGDGGVTDNTAALNLADIAAKALGIDHVYLAPGVYHYSGTLTISPGVTFHGPECGVPNASADYPVRFVHTATAPGTDAVTLAAVAPGSTQSAGNLKNISITAQATGNTRYGFYLHNPIGGRSSNLQFSGAFSGAMIAGKGFLNCKFSNIRMLNGTSVEVPAAILVQSSGNDIYSTTLTFEDIYVGGVFGVALPGGVASVLVAEPAGGKQIIFERCVYESINGKAFNVGKGNQVMLLAPYCENVPNLNVNTPMFEVGVTGAAAPNNAYDSATSFVVDCLGGSLMQYSQGSATLTKLFNTDVAQYVEIRNAQLDRCITLISGTNNTQQFRMENIKSSSITTVYAGLTDYKVFDGGGNVFSAASMTASHKAGANATRQSVPPTLYSHGDIYFESDVGTEGRASWFDKTSGIFRSMRVKNGTAPTLRSYIRGDAVDNAFPSVGGAAGWSCTATGTGGAATFIMSGQSGVAKGNTASRPTKTTFQVVNDTDWSGAWYHDTTLAAIGKPIQWSGSAWVDPTAALTFANVAATTALTTTSATSQFVDATSGAATMTLPTAASASGMVFNIKKIDASANAVTIDANGIETIDGALTVALTVQWQSVQIQSNGAAWYIL